jgi:TonB-linked SusC/RagA family outer membrane protein
MKYLFTKNCLLLLSILFISTTAMAQFTVTGSVKDSQDEPLIGVSILVKGTATGTVTDFDGNFSLEVPSGNEATLEISYIGFAAVEQEVSSSNNNVSIVLADQATNLDEIVVTGLATSVKRSNLANAVASIDSKELTGVTSQSTMDGALYGKFKGAEIRSNSGAPGGGMSVKLRGVTSIRGDQQPLYIIDGIFLDNSSISLGTNVVSAAAGGGNTSTNQDDASNRIADIDPEDIETIEILKGASAAAIYGSRAAGGVVIITTKKGKAGQKNVTFSQTVGFARPISLLGTRDWDTEKVRSVFGDADADLFQQNGLIDYEKELFDNTPIRNTSRLEFSGGTNQTTYFVGGTYKNENGIVDNTGYEKVSARINLSHKFNDWLDISLSNNFINAIADRGFFNNSNSNTTIGYAMAFTKPWVDLFADADGNFPANPGVGSNVLETVSLITNRENINRYIGGGIVNLSLITNANNSLKLVFRGGTDRYTLRTTGIFPQQLSYFQDPTSLGGASISGSTVNSVTNIVTALIFTHYTDSGISFRTQVGVTQENFNQNTVVTTATGLNGSQTNIDQAANVSGFQNRVIQQDKGFFAQEEFNWNDRFIATVGIRGDKSSNNGDANKLYFYPKANAAVNLHNFDFWTADAISSLKARVAYGQAGRFANFIDRFNSLNGTLIGMNSGLQTSALRGNTQVGPERQSELEFGIDVGILNNKFTLDATYYIKEIDDLLLAAQVPSSTGFTSQIVNAGALQNQGIEIGINGAPIQTPNFSWDFTINWWKNTSEVTRLDIPAFNIGGFAASLGQFRIQEGQSATQIVGTLNPDDCQTGDCSDLDPDGDGFRVYGNAEADFNMAWRNQIKIKNFSLSFLWHWKQGGQGINLSTLLWDLGNLTWDYDDVTLDPAGVTPNGDYRKNSWFAGDTGPWIEDTGYIRLREVGAYYTIPKESLNGALNLTLGVSGRNLLNFFDYNSYDPEVSNFGGNVLANNVEVTPFPSSKIFNFHIKAEF